MEDCCSYYSCYFILAGKFSYSAELRLKKFYKLSAVFFVTEVKACNIEADPGDTDYNEVLEEDDILDLKTLHIDTTLTVHNLPAGTVREKSSRKRISKVQGKKIGSLSDKRTGRNKFWTLKFKGKMQIRSASDIKRATRKEESKCVCMSYKRSNSESSQDYAVNDKEQWTSVVPVSTAPVRSCRDRNATASLPVVNLDELYPVNDIDEERIQQRRREMENGIEIENIWVYRNGSSEALAASDQNHTSRSNSPGASVGQYPSYGAMGLLSDQPCLGIPTKLGGSVSSLNCPWVLQNSQPQQIHTQIDYIHYLVPDLDKIVSSSFYWGVMDRYQAEKLIENKPEGTFLLRDSAQEEFLFSVSFRRYGRSLHARIEQWNHKFSFDSRDPGVYATKSVCGLIDHYKDPSCCMFFEPMLTLPLHRTFPFSLQHLARAKICSNVTYDGISQLSLPRALKEYLQIYHYKQKVRVRRFDNAA